MDKYTAVFLIMAMAGFSDRGQSEVKTESTENTKIQSESIVTIDAESAKNAGITLGTAGPAVIKETLPLSGIVQTNAEHVRSIRSRYPGVVKSVNVSLGDHVNAGDVLATVESSDSLQTFPVKTPISGIVTERTINPGEVTAEQALLTIADMSTVRVDFSLPAQDRQLVCIGQPVTVHALQGDTVAQGHVDWISPVASTETQSVSVLVQLDNTQNLWTPGVYVTGDITLKEYKVALAVKTSALQKIDDNVVVFVENKGGYIARPVKLGRSDGVITEIIDGIEVNEKYVSHNSFVIKADIEKSSIDDKD